MKLAATPLAFQGRIRFLRVLVIFGFMAVLTGYYRVQILNQERYEALGEKYRIKKRRIKAARGLIYDRTGVLVTQNMPTYNLVLRRDEMEEPWRLLRSKIATFLGMAPEELQKRYSKKSHLFSQPILLKENIDFKETLRVKRNQLRYPGLGIEVADKRFYTHDHLFSHVLGYMGEASQAHLSKNPRLRLGDQVGRNGIELAYDTELTGVDGERVVLMNHRGLIREEKEAIPPKPGKDLYLTLDFKLQQLAAESLKTRNGAVVMMDVNTGEILVYVSSESFDLNLFTDGISEKNWNTLLNSPGQPFLNRPIQGSYAPGSIFKLVTALAALNTKKVSLNTKYFCNGALTLYNHEFHCHRKSGHGWMDLSQAVQTSCNVFFYNLARDMDPNALADMAFKLGFGHLSGIDLSGEKPGFVPTPAWKKKYFKEIWYPGDSLSFAIGQGSLQTTPLQLAGLMAIIATQGKAPVPHLQLKTTNYQSTEHYQIQHRLIGGIPKEFYTPLRQAMWRVVNQTQGTGSKARVEGFDVCGKTGTAQLITFTSEADHKVDAYKNAWFAGFAPLKEPQVVVVVLVEKAGAGGVQAAPIAKKLFEAYRKRKAEAYGSF